MIVMGPQQQLYIFLFIFDENVRENLWVTKGIGGERGIGVSFYYENGDGDGNDNGNCVRERGIGQAGGGGMEGCVCFY
jgi:hypothetical protein